MTDKAATPETSDKVDLGDLFFQVYYGTVRLFAESPDSEKIHADMCHKVASVIGEYVVVFTEMAASDPTWEKLSPESAHNRAWSEFTHRLRKEHGWKEAPNKESTLRMATQVMAAIQRQVDLSFGSIGGVTLPGES